MRSAIESRLSTSQLILLDRIRSILRGLGHAFRNNRLALLSLGVLIVFALVGIFADVLAPYDPLETQYKAGEPLLTEPPQEGHILGTNSIGRDIFSQWVHGARVSLSVGVLSGISVMIVGSTIGVVSGYYRGTVDLVIMRVVDMMYAIPAVPLILMLALVFISSTWMVVLAMILVLWRTMARVIRAQTLSIAERPFVKSARATGASDLRIMAVHIYPNILPIAIIEGVIVTGNAILIEASVAFLGIGSPELVSWGQMLQLVLQSGALNEAWWWIWPPGLSIAMVVVSLFFMSRAIEDYVNPEARRV